MRQSVPMAETASSTANPATAGSLAGLAIRFATPRVGRVMLLHVLRPGDDGLIIGSGRHQALFLPSVWQQLPQPDDFVDQLFRKAGLRPEPWPTDLAASVFTTDTFHRSLR